MLTDDGKPITAHSTNPVPLIFVRGGGGADPRDGGRGGDIRADANSRDDDGGGDVITGLADGGALSDVAPTLLDMMGIPAPVEMTGRSLLVRK
jgi:2,3-bisphosphoglycerate-independent phosphoglycerate mutase